LEHVQRNRQTEDDRGRDRDKDRDRQKDLVAGNGRGEEAAGDERAWLRGRLWTAWVQGGGWKWMGRRRRWGWASLAARTADGVGARGWLEMGGEEKPLGMSELGCADGCGRRGWKGVAGNGWGERECKMVACRLAMCAYRLTVK